MERIAPWPAAMHRLRDWHRFALAGLACALTTLLATPLLGVLDLANIVMLFLLTVLLVAVGLGRGAAVLAAFLSVLMFDVFFVPPRFSLAVHDAQYLVTFAVMLAVALITGHLTAGLRRQAEIASDNERQTRALYEMARELAGALSVGQVAEITRRFLRGSIDADAALLLPDADGKLVPVGGGDGVPGVDPVMARLAFDSRVPVDGIEPADGNYASACFPLKAPMRVRGVLAVRPLDAVADTVHTQKSLLETAASLVAVAVERLHYVEVAQSTQVEMISERLRSSILSALSHDLRTPLTALVGLADSLTLVKPPLPTPALETAQALHEQALRMSGLVANLLDMARLHAGQVTLRREWQPVEEVVGAAIKLLGGALGTHPVKVSLAADLPLLEFDAVLMERVFSNLIENAAKYSPPGSVIEIGAVRRGEVVAVSVCDRGGGFPQNKDDMFEMFVRSEAESAKPGVGLGLAICRAIVEAHGGNIVAANRDGGGACVSFTLPIGNPPTVEEEIVQPAGDAI